MSNVGKSKRGRCICSNALGGYCICILIIAISLTHPLLLIFKLLGLVDCIYKYPVDYGWERGHEHWSVKALKDHVRIELKSS